MVRTLSPKEAQALLSKGGVDLVDVRDPNEWATGHLPGARLVPLAQLKADAKPHLPSPRVVFVCAKGGRSMTAAKIADELGLEEVYSLDGGTIGWANAGLPLDGLPVKTATVATPPPASDPSEPEIGLDGIVGTNVRELRAKKGYTLDVLAKMTGLSRQLLGQIELGRTAPSVSVVWKVARAFEVPFSALLATPGKVETKVLPSATAKRLVSADGRYSSRALFPFGEQQRVEFYELRLAGHSREDAEPHAPGTRENLVVVSGRLDVELSGERHSLNKGDAIVFGADVAHSYVNPGSEECFMHLVMTYAT
ncbi:MAG: helix-turn-helix domain-containing protein [Deltaproteobacteria bacterium]|nr:helix-turn-helix domain-containing protein [Deltaproteobacteria bacterium]